MIARLALAFGLAATAAAAPAVRVGSKNFTESYVLGELIAQLLEARGHRVERVPGLGGTMVCFRALAAGEIDVYPEYTGTIEQEILKSTVHMSEAELRRRMRDRGLEMLPTFGFNNTYAIALRAHHAEQLWLRRISDLADRPTLRGGLSYEFLARADGWPALARVYGLPQRPARMEHGLAYDALRAGEIDFTDAYTTDAKIERYGLAILDDDRAFFPRYMAVPLVRAGRAAELRPLLAPLGGLLDEEAIRRLNARVEIERRSFAEVARGFLVGEGLVEGGRAGGEPLAARLGRRTLEHLGLTLVALVAATLLAVPLGLVAYRRPRLGTVILSAAGLLQTVPSIALLALLIPLLGIGKLPAVVALFVYSLLPVVRNTHAGLESVEPQYRVAADAMGLTPREKLRLVELPLALPVVVAGVKTAAVICIGTATLAAFVGAGGLGEPVVTGLALNDARMILEGAVPAAALAVATELAFRSRPGLQKHS